MGRRSLTSQRWGVLGGIFDPIHYGHLTIAEQARDELDLTKVVFVPTGRPVHKGLPDANSLARMRMVEMAIADNPAFEASWVEINSDRPSYMVDTLRVIAADHNDVDLILIVSNETAALMPTWRSPEELLDLVHVAIANRLGYPEISSEWIREHFPGREGRFTHVNTTFLGHSSTVIRERVAARRSIRYLVPAAVETYIEDNHLYGA